MREIISYPPEGPIRELRCSLCNWVFRVQHPVTQEVSLELQTTYAQRWFAAHSCREVLSRGDNRMRGFTSSLESALASGGVQ